MNRIYGGVLIAIGILLMTGSGLCSLSVILSWRGNFTPVDLVLLPLIFGGLPFGLGLGLFFWGRRLLRRPDWPEEDEPDGRFG